MQMNKQQKVFAAVLGSGLLALGVDRVVFDTPATGPHAAAAAAAFVPALTASSTHDVVALAREALDEAPAMGEPPPNLAERLNEVAQQHYLPPELGRDAFAPSDAWMTAIEPVREVKPTHDADARRFQQSHRLMAIMTPGGRGVVVVNNQAMRVGQRINGFTLTLIEHHQATFHGPSGPVVLKLDP